MAVADADLELKLRFRRILFLEGYWAPIEVELSHYEADERAAADQPQARAPGEPEGSAPVTRRSLTDLDVLGIRFDPLLKQHRVVGDCKTGRRHSEVSRLFWLRGVLEFFGAEQGYFIKPRVDPHVRAVAPKLGLRVVSEPDLAALEAKLGVSGLRVPIADPAVHADIANLWGIEVAPGAKPSAEALRVKDAYSFLSYLYWYVEPHRRLLSLIPKFEQIAELLDPSNPRHVLLAFVGAQRFAHSMLELAENVYTYDGSGLPERARLYLYGGPLAANDKRRLFDLLRKVGINEELDPPYLGDLVELLGRVIKNPHGTSDVLRHLDAMYVWNAHLRNTDPPSLAGGTVNTAALVLAKDLVTSFVRAAGIKEDLFKAIKNL